MIVLDCKAALEMMQGSAEGQALKQLMLDGEKVISTELFYGEVSNELWKCVRAGLLDTEEANQYLDAAIHMVDEFCGMEEFTAEVISEAVRLNHPAYDLFYLVLARRTGSTLFTLDKRLQNLCLDNGVNCVFMDTEF